MYSTVFFDVYGTVARINHPATPYRVFKEKLPERWRDFKSVLMTGDYGLPEMQDKFSLALTEAELHASEADIALQQQSITLFDDAIPTFRLLRGKGIKVGLISNLAQPYGGPIRDLIADEVDDYIFSFEVGFIKPDKAIFDQACKRFSCAHNDALMVGDSFRSDYQGAKLAGLDALLLKRDALSDEMHVIASLNELTLKCE